MIIDLRKFYEPLVCDIKQSLESFVAKHSDLQLCTVGLFGDGFHGSASLHLDTPEHSEAHVQQWLKNGPNWYGEDAQGRFCNNCWDFAHCIGEFVFPDYPDLYDQPLVSMEDYLEAESLDLMDMLECLDDEIPQSIDFITLNGKTERAKGHEGNEGINQVIFPFLKSVMESIGEFREMKHAEPFRIGVQMHDSNCEVFWLVNI